MAVRSARAWTGTRSGCRSSGSWFRATRLRHSHQKRQAEEKSTRMTLTDRPWRLLAVAKSRSLSTKIHSSQHTKRAASRLSRAIMSSVTAYIQHTAVTRPHSRTLASLERDRHADGADRSSAEAARRSPGSDARRSSPVVASASPQTRHPTTALDGTATRTPNRSRSCSAAEARPPTRPNGSAGSGGKLRVGDSKCSRRNAVNT